MTKRTFLALAPLVLTFAAQASAEQAPTPEWVRVRQLTYAGTGCPAGTVAANVSPDGLAFRLLMDSFVAEVGPGVPITAARKNCQINLDLDHPQGWSYALAETDYRGFVSLDAGVTATQALGLYFQGQAHTVRLASTFNGPVSRDFFIRDTLSGENLLWSPCGAQRSLNMNVQVSLSHPQADERGLISLDSPLAEGPGGFTLIWRQCN